MQQNKGCATKVTVPMPSFNIIFDLRDVLFLYHPHHRGTPAQFTAIKEMIGLLHQISVQTNHIGKPRHRLYVLSNATQESYHNFISYHTDIFSYFQGIVVSAFSGFQKPDREAYIYLLDKYDLDPQTCIFIDDKKENIAAAQAVGMHGIVYTHPDQIHATLKNYKIL